MYYMEDMFHDDFGHFAKFTEKYGKKMLVRGPFLQSGY